MYDSKFHIQEVFVKKKKLFQRLVLQSDASKVSGQMNAGEAGLNLSLVVVDQLRGEVREPVQSTGDHVNVTPEIHQSLVGQ